jgi:hypothetical protein
MQLTPRQALEQFAHVLQQNLFPALEEVTGEQEESLKLVVAVLCIAPLGRMLSARKAATGRPAKDRASLATAFMAKAILNLATTRDLISRLRVDEALRRICGWASASAVPHESKFRGVCRDAVAATPARGSDRGHATGSPYWTHLS